MQVCLVAMPFQNIENPVLSLSLLKGCLTEKNISSSVVYCNMDFARMIGMKAYYTIARGGSCREALLGEAAFAQSAFGEMPKGYESYLEKELTPHIGQDSVRKILACLYKARQEADAFLRQAAEKILAHNPCIVACASTTQQNCACFAFFRVLKKMRPDIITVLGGPNCERVMGKVIAEKFPWADYVISGEADSFWGDFCCKLLKGQRKFPEYSCVFSVKGNNNPLAGGFTEELDSIPYPDFTDYFNALEKFAYKKYVKPGLLIETSRGCWWGEKNPCTFCGMNGASRKYRKKSAARVVEEFRYLKEKYRINNFFAVDCILAQDFWLTVLPELEKLNLHIMYEIKTNIGRSHIRQLKKSGIFWVQPGIESLQDDLLRLMNKGNRAIKHIELLKRMSEFGIRCCWLLLCGFPGEQEEWYEKQIGVMRLLTHLQPPDAVFRLRYDRFSIYEQFAGDFGIKLDAAKSYYYIYPASYHAVLKDLAYFLTNEKKPQPLYGQGFTKKVHCQMLKVADKWRSGFYSPLRDRLTAKVSDGVVEVLDLRSCAKKSFYRLTGCQAELVLAADEAVLLKKVADKLTWRYSGQEINEAVEFLKQAGLLLQIDDEILFLALFSELALPEETEPPAGSICAEAFLEGKNE